MAIKFACSVNNTIEEKLDPSKNGKKKSYKAVLPDYFA